MIRVGQIKLKPNHSEQDLIRKIVQILRISEHEIRKIQIKKQSLDARKKPELKYVYTVDVEVVNERQVLNRQKNSNVSGVKDKPYEFSVSGTLKLQYRPVVVGSGPAGMFCAYFLAQYGYRPIVIERVKEIEERNQ